jgi:hypothetical protein
MKYACLEVIFLSLGMIGCAPTPSQSTSEVTRDENTTRTALTSATLTHLPTQITTLTPTATLAPTTLPASTATEASKPMPTNTLLARPSATPLPTNTPTLQPAASPTRAAAPAVSAASANNEEQVKRGLEVYKQLYCGLCHKLDVAGTAGTFGPPHNGMGTIAAQRIQDPQYIGQATTAADYLLESIVDPKVFVVPGYEQTQHHMPVYNYLTEADVAALVQMLLQQK